ncbi:MAG: type II toxin-antitoxin system prevent-host-death family antitoxin [Candidatus Thiodiazotropha sp. (ex Rostrolucina anterorostrata)]|nr:type II toxin-antitoxin system prevent-host-death family antitoxin [Candidatus Thiodiazotropha sp. (ex Rostrolucina anterorostrata)]
MDAIAYSIARAKLASTMDQVCEDHAPVIITRKGAGSVVMISLDDYQALEETAYLLRSPKNARRLLESIAELESGGGSDIPVTLLQIGQRFVSQSFFQAFRDVGAALLQQAFHVARPGTVVRLGNEGQLAQ